MMCRLTSLCYLLVIVLLNSAVDGIPCRGPGGWCSTLMWCCAPRDVCCGIPGFAVCRRESECPWPRIPQGPH
uniref:Conotoxin superfamily I2 n=1 Tax=Conus ermineus TaxID=55423 RepID=A0A346CJE9_CONER|nr:conotoxin superfamily I2 [Conus ermineus]